MKHWFSRRLESQRRVGVRVRRVMLHSLLAQPVNSERDPAAAWDAAMRAGDFAAAWAISDAVLAGRDPATRDQAGVPYHLRWVWDGRPFDGRRVVVRCYHGLGDTLQFCRYLRALRERAGHVTLEVQGALVGLLGGMVDEVRAFDWGAPLPPGECDIEIMELAHALRMAPEGDAYLSVRAERGGGVGVCWAAGGWDPGRDMPARVLAPLGPVVSLQRGAAAMEGERLGFVDPLGGSMDLERLAGLVAGLDAVVTVDTMVAHLAGALGRPVFVLLKQGADWRWGLGERCCWYASARLFRQRQAGNWAEVVRELCFSGALGECGS